MRQPYHFATLRYVLNQATGEFANVGVVMLVLGRGQLFYRLNDRYSRLSKFFSGGFDGASYRRGIAVLRAHFAGVAEGLRQDELFAARIEGLPDLLPRLLATDASAFQWSDVMSGVHVEPARRVEELFQEMVTRHEDNDRRPRSTGR